MHSCLSHVYYVDSCSTAMHPSDLRPEKEDNKANKEWNASNSLSSPQKKKRRTIKPIKNETQVILYLHLKKKKEEQ